jgi:hypothetical protein
MARFLSLATLVFTCAVLIALPVRADEPPRKLTAEERKELEAKGKKLTGAGIMAHGDGNDIDCPGRGRPGVDDLRVRL